MPTNYAGERPGGTGGADVVTIVVECADWVTENRAEVIADGIAAAQEGVRAATVRETVALGWTRPGGDDDDDE
jgi:hypothetical protein